MRRKEQDPDEKLDYVIDWKPRLQDGESIAQSEFLDPDPVTTPPLVLSDESRSSEATIFWATGGKAGTLYNITNRVVTDSVPARTMDVTVAIKVYEK